MDKELDYFREINANLRFAVVTLLFIILKLNDVLILGWSWILLAIAIDFYLVVSAGININKGAELCHQALVKNGIIKGDDDEDDDEY
jgi:predicted permease